MVAATSGRSGTWNVSSGRATSINDLLQEMEGMIGPAVAVTLQPSRPGDVPRSSLSPVKIGRELGWSPRVSLEAGLRSLLDEVHPNVPQRSELSAR